MPSLKTVKEDHFHQFNFISDSVHRVAKLLPFHRESNKVIRHNCFNFQVCFGKQQNEEGECPHTEN